MVLGQVSIPASGFNFENCLRNSFLESKGFPVPKTTKTGTTIAGLVYKDGVVLGADTRATSGTLVAEKNCQKIHYLAENMGVCGAGTAADCEQVSRMVSSQLKLHRLATDRIVPVVMAEHLFIQHLFKYQGHIGCAMIIGGVDFSGPHLYQISPHGHSQEKPFITMGSGSLAAMSVFESRYKINMSLEEAKSIVRDAIAAGIFNDLGSGGSVDLCVINKEGTQFLRPYDVANKKIEKMGSYRYKPGTGAVLSTVRIPLDVVDKSVRKFKVMEDGDSNVDTEH